MNIKVFLLSLKCYISGFKEGLQLVTAFKLKRLLFASIRIVYLFGKIPKKISVISLIYKFESRRVDLSTIDVYKLIFNGR